jgi:spermidine synthase
VSESERTVLDRRATPQGEAQLQQRVTPQGELAYEIILNGVFIMASYNQASERALATLALPSGVPAGPGSMRVLVGGLGMGYTLQAVLEHRQVGPVDVVEIEPAVVDWHRRFLGGLSGHSLDDPRVRLVEMDIVRFLAGDIGPYRAICLDVDNGPGWLAVNSNRRLYSTWGLGRLRGLLAPGGVLTVWSAAPARAFAARLGRVFGQAEAHPVVSNDPWGHELAAYIYRAVR